MPLARKTPMKRGGRIRPRNRKRHSAEWLRAYGSAERVQWVASQPCVVSGYTPCDNVHTRGGGAGRKADYVWIVPMLRTHHHQLHRIGKASFEKRYSLDLDALAGVTELAWRAHQGPSHV